MSTQEQRKKIHVVLVELNKRGKLTPEEVVRLAEDENNPLHAEFEWDDGQAAQKWRLAQARSLISGFRVEIVVHERSYNIQEFVERPAKENQREQGYVSIRDIRTDKAMAAEFLDREIGVAQTYISKTAEFAKVLGMERKIERLHKSAGSVREQALAAAR